MKVRRLRIEDVRQFRQPLEIAGFNDGINLFVGPNESGKSTLAAAIRAVFLERHRSGGVDHLRPWQDSGAAPQVEIEFDFAGQHWQLSKTFLKKARCDLRVDGTASSGAEAEERLAEVFGFEYAGKGASRAETWGIPGLLWVEQGLGQEIAAPVSHASDHLKTVLGMSVGEVASSAGDGLLKAVESQLSDLLTSGGKPRGVFQEVSKQVETLTDRKADLAMRIDSYQRELAQLGDLRQAHSRDEADRPWESFRQQQDAATLRLQAAQRLREQREVVGQSLNDARSREQMLVEKIADYERDQSDLATRKQELQKAVESIDSIKRLIVTHEDAERRALADYEQARLVAASARTHAARTVLLRDQQRISKEIQSLGGVLEEVRQWHHELVAIRADLARVQIDPKAVKSLEKLTEHRQELEIRIKAVATRVVYEIEAGHSAQLGDESLRGKGEKLLTDTTVLGIDGVGHFTVVPGGEDLGELRREIGDYQDKLTALLLKLQVASVAEARSRLEQCKDFQQRERRLAELLELRAPGGIAGLEEDRSILVQQEDALAQQLVTMPVVNVPDLPLEMVAEAKVETAGNWLKEAEHLLRKQREELNRAEAIVGVLATELEKLNARLGSQEWQAQNLQARHDMVRLGEELRGKQVEVQRIDAKIADARVDILEQEIRRFGDSADQLQKTHEDRRIQLVRLEERLASADAEGLPELHGEVSASLVAATQRHAELERRSRALALLVELLTAQRAAVTARLQEPLQRRIVHYLQLLFPGARLLLDENLVPQALDRAGAQSVFEALSFGAREQMGLISRLAYADLLQEAGRPTLIILDDALVHSDSDRLARMKSVLYDAGQRHQVLLFSCHPENWRDLGVIAREMNGLAGTKIQE